MQSNHQAKKKFGQNFLTDKNLLKKIVKSADIINQNVIEVGPGRGALTEYLIPECKTYIGYEIDLTLKNYLLSKYQQPKVNFFFKDFMQVDIEDDVNKIFNGEESHLVANLPYYITTPIIFKFLQVESIRTATIMVQKEVGNRLISSTNEKSYNALSAILQYYCRVTKVVDVNRKMFNPVPNVDSMVIRLVKLCARVENEKFYEQFCKALFLQKRKLVTNNLSQAYAMSKEEVKEWLIKQGYKETTRAEELSVDQIINLSIDFKKVIERK